MASNEEQKTLKHVRAAVWFSAARVIAWIVFAVYVYVFNYSLAKLVSVVFTISMITAIETAFGVYSAKRAERAVLEETGEG